MGMAAAAGVGVLGAIVWPAYVGAMIKDPGPGPFAFGELYTNGDYERGQIQWGMENGDIVGRAFIKAPAGFVYTHLAYFHGPTGECMSGKMQLPHPIGPFPNAGVIEIYPITNPDLQLLKAQGIDY